MEIAGKICCPCEYIGKFICGSIFLALGILASLVATVIAAVTFPFLLIAYVIYEIKTAYHKWQTKNSKGIPLSEDIPAECKMAAYRYGKAVFSQEDLPRLRAEKKRLKCIETKNKVLAYIKTATICLLPICGPILVLYQRLSQSPSKIDKGESSGCKKCQDEDKIFIRGVRYYPISSTLALNYHINILLQNGEDSITIRNQFLSPYHSHIINSK